MTRPVPSHIILMGVSGAGKTTVGQRVAALLGIPFIDADDHHPPANRRKMADGQALTDRDRWPWLDALNRQLAGSPPAVLACSALRGVHRTRLARDLQPQPHIVWLDVPADVLASRLQRREAAGEHFMPRRLLESQLATLEPPPPSPHTHRIPADQPVDRLVSDITLRLGLT